MEPWITDRRRAWDEDRVERARPWKGMEDDELEEDIADRI